MTDAPITRAEFGMLAERVSENARRLDTIDQGGTRGVAVVQLQITELAKDFAKHEEQHTAAEARRLSGRRWAIALGVAAIAAIDGPMVTILLARGR